MHPSDERAGATAAAADVWHAGQVKKVPGSVLANQGMLTQFEPTTRGRGIARRAEGKTKHNIKCTTPNKTSNPSPARSKEEEGRRRNDNNNTWSSPHAKAKGAPLPRLSGRDCLPLLPGRARVRKRPVSVTPPTHKMVF